MPSMPTSAYLPPITPTQLALHHTRFSNWFPLYRRHSPKATVIDLLSIQTDFVDWLEEDGIVLPKDSEEEEYSIDRISLNDLNGNDDGEQEEEEEEEAEPRNFDPLNERIRQVLSTYEGAVFPKLDWSAPLDAAWIVPGSTLRCTTPSDVYLLLKSSDFVSKDLVQLRELEVMKQRLVSNSSSEGQSPTTVRPTLVLKKYFAIPTSHEFRCFVRAGQFICISQRDTGTFFEHLQDQDAQFKIRKLLQKFYFDVLSPLQNTDSQSSLRRNFFPIDDFVWDAYISRDMSRVFLIDVNPFLERTDALLWTWSEVEDIAERWSRGEEGSDDEADEDDDDDDDQTVMRIFTDGREPMLIRPNGQGTQPMQQTRVLLPHLRTITSRAQTTQSFPTYSRNMVPSDVVGAAEGNNIAEFAKEWNHKIAQIAVEDIDGDEDEVMPGPGR